MNNDGSIGTSLVSAGPSFAEDREAESCGNLERHEYELYLAIEDIDHTHPKTKSPQTNGICERLPKTLLDGFVTKHKEVRTHQGG